MQAHATIPAASAQSGEAPAAKRPALYVVASPGPAATKQGLLVKCVDRLMSRYAGIFEPPCQESPGQEPRRH